MLSYLGEPIIEKWEDGLKETLIRLRHHDEFFMIFNLKKIEVEWCFGVASALGYTKEDEEKWSIMDQHFLIHDRYYSTFLALGFMMNGVLHDMNMQLTPLGHRYIINIPLRKRNGSYVWVKQLSTPISIDENGRMIRQFNSYTIISGYKGIALPFLPRIFLADGTRAREVEKNLFKRFMSSSLFSISPTQKRVAQAALMLWNKKFNAMGESVDESRPIVPVSHQEIALFMRSHWGKIHSDISQGTVRNHVNELKDRAEESFGFRFPGVVEVAQFLKKLYCLEED